MDNYNFLVTFQVINMQLQQQLQRNQTKELERNPNIPRDLSL